MQLFQGIDNSRQILMKMLTGLAVLVSWNLWYERLERGRELFYRFK